MTVHYVDTSASSNGTGTLQNPRNTLSGLIPAQGDTLLLKTGTVIPASTVSSSILSQSNVTIGEYGTGAKPILSGGFVRSDFVESGTADVYQRTYATNIVGNVVENGRSMRFVAWNTDLATTAALMTAGSFSFDYNNLILYITPTSGTAAQNEYIVSETTFIIITANASSGFILRNLDFRHASRHAFAASNKKNFLIDGVAVRFAGGIRSVSGGYHLGNGIELSVNCVGAEVKDCVIEDIFDSAFTSQLYETVPASLSDHYYHDMTIRRCGMAAAEISIQSNAVQMMKNIVVEDMVAENIGKNCWSGNRGGWVTLTGAVAGQGNGIVTGCVLSRITATNAEKLSASSSTSGVNHWVDCIGTGITTPGSSVPTYGRGQADVLRNVLADGVAPSGGAFVQSVGYRRHAAVLV